MNQNLSGNDPKQRNHPNPDQGAYPGYPMNQPAQGGYPSAGNVNPADRQPGQFTPQGGFYPPPYGQPGPQQPEGGQRHPSHDRKQPKKASKPKKPSNAKWVWLGILIMLIFIAAGAVFGYNSAVSARRSTQKEQSVKAAAQQYQLAMTDMEAGNFENAKTRLEYVLSIDPNYPGATEKYTNVMVSLFPKETPTPFYTPTPAPSSTPDTRGEADLLNTIRANMQSQDWATAIENIEALRNKNLDYESMEVDGLYYIALRNYGIQQINNGYLEPGIYRITLAEAFGPIDAVANNQRAAARNYLAGAGFWEIDWEKALQYYANSYQVAPGMYDRASGYTAQERYIRASFEYGQKLLTSAEQTSNQSLYCQAVDYFAQGFSMSANESFAPAATQASIGCYPPTATPEIVVPTEMLATPTVQGATGGESGEVPVAPIEVGTSVPLSPPDPSLGDPNQP